MNINYGSKSDNTDSSLFDEILMSFSDRYGDSIKAKKILMIPHEVIIEISVRDQYDEIKQYAQSIESEFEEIGKSLSICVIHS
ncbi:MAG: hypothetical protein HOC71_12475 [Candidatus Latescibacteria bacterium]|jgi:predicted P-loop ATPase|nr:hypothetical protein [Candidatus Latescibacterota bacterium]